MITQDPARKEISLPKIYNTTLIELSVIKGNDRKLATDQKSHGLSIDQICPGLESRLTNLIPQSETNLRAILKTSVTTEQSVPFLQGLLSKGFDKETLSLRKEFAWRIFTIAVPFLVNYNQLVEMFNSLNTFWQGHAEISFQRQDPYYCFNFKWL